MFQTFSGSSRRPRNVNLSGSARGGLSGFQQTSRPGGPSGSSTVLQAQQERRARQIERERLQAAKTLQRVWRGHAARRRIAAQCRSVWDTSSDQMMQAIHRHIPPDESVELPRARSLSWFASKSDPGDLERVCCFSKWLETFLSQNATLPLRDDWKMPLVQLAMFALEALDTEPGKELSPRVRENLAGLLDLVYQTAHQFPDDLMQSDRAFYSSLRKVLCNARTEYSEFKDLLADIVLAPLMRTSTAQPTAFEAFAREIVTIPDLQKYTDLTRIAIAAKNNHLARSMRKLVTSTGKGSLLATLSKNDLAWTLANFIYFHRISTFTSPQSSPSIDFIATITAFLSNLDHLTGKHYDIHSTVEDQSLPSFIEDQIAFLIKRESIMRFITLSGFDAPGIYNSDGRSEEAATLASYALMLLQSFPRRADDIRSWLYMSSTPVTAHASEEPAIKYFWKVVSRSNVYQSICASADNAVNLLKYEKLGANSSIAEQRQDREWRVIFLFLELYTFVLKIMDDDEFMGGDEGFENASRTRRSALELSQVRQLTIFLKNLAFTMYWNAKDIMGVKEKVETHSLAAYFGNRSSDDTHHDEIESVDTPLNRSFAGVDGMSLAYMKGMITGLLRMLYERDSRRHFCEVDHWLAKGLDMRGFIEAVFVEQTFRDEEEDGDRNEEDMDLDLESDDDSLVGTTRTKQIRRLEKLRLQQQRASRQKLLKSRTPRLELLQNMPFFIPFATRVAIFRQFVVADQMQRRDGFIDADQWRMSLTMGAATSQLHRRLHDVQRRSAKVRREHVFEDAFKQFYELGEDLKEPIQITFVDQFDTPEAGIDGGGVTKEFLTSITTEAFSTEAGQSLFVENDENLLYPNPSAVDERRELLRDAGLLEGSPEWNMHLRELLQHYEFLGRILGKCLYEGILEDIHFAPFFLIKWALTGGSGSATNETGYRANINDLRDLDKELYQNLLKLKNYPGDVEDFSLDFTVTDVVRRDDSGAAVKSVTRDLRPGGATIPVTNDNRLIYISAVARHRLQSQPAPQTNAFLKGLSAMIQPAWLSMFNQSELQTLLGGDAAEIDVADLRANTSYGGVYVIGDDGQEHPTVQQFWNVLTEMGDEDRRKVLKYVTSTPRGPLLGFSQLNPRFSIRDSGNEQSRLPSTSTCVNLLKLPIYTTKAVLRERLLYAVNAGAGFNLS